MKNLENYGVQELNAQELSQIEGGNPIRVLYTIAKTIWNYRDELTEAYEEAAEKGIDISPIY